MHTTSRRPVTAWMLGSIAVVHVLITPLVYRPSVESIVEGGVIAAIEQDPAQQSLRGVGFWYVTTGLALLLAAIPIGRIERRDGRPPAEAVWGLAALATWGSALMPKSGFPALAVTAGVAALRRRGVP